MDRIIDKTIVSVCCITALLIVPFTTEIVVGLLLAVCVSSMWEVPFIAAALRKAFLVAYLVACLFFPYFSLFVPLIAYDCWRMKNVALKLCWLVPLLVSFRELSGQVFIFLLAVSTIALCLSWRTQKIEKERNEHTELRDEMRELSLSLEQKNRDLQQKQDYEVKLATLSERGRIAREIHDNVGHILTRSVLQIEALQVVHAKDRQVKEELEQIGVTVHEAFDTVRDSVHDLHEDAFDLYSELSQLVSSEEQIDAELNYEVNEIPSSIGYSILAIIREALSNTTRHSDASKLKISLIEYPAFWQLIIHDNGSKDPFEIGSLPQTMKQSSWSNAEWSLADFSYGIGLKTMEERTRLSGGVFRFEYNKGFRIFVTIPTDESRE